MKKTNKNGLLKGIGIILLIAVLLSWVTPYATFNEGVLTKDEFQRVGLFDISTYSLMSFSYFAAVFGYLFVLAGFSKFVNSLDAFKKLVSSIAKKIGKYEFVFVIASMVFYAILASIIKETLVLFLFVPFTLAIMSELKQTKISTFTATIGGILLGTLGSTFNGTITGIIKSVFTIKDYNPEVIASIVVVILGGALLGVLTFIAQKNKSEEKVENFLAVESKSINKKVSVIPLIVIGVIVSVFSILAFLDWSGFGVTVFSDLATNITESTIGGVTVFKFIIGETDIAFGLWTLYTLSGFLLLNTFILAVIYRVKFNEVVESYVEGFRAYAKVILAVFLIYVVFETSYFFPTLAIVYDGIKNLFGDNAFTWTLITFIATVFSSLYEYVISPLSGLFLHVGTSHQEVVALSTQFGYGLASFIAPTSMMLAVGLTMLDISYKKYVKFIWKFVVAMAIITILVSTILLHI